MDFNSDYFPLPNEEELIVRYEQANSLGSNVLFEEDDYVHIIMHYLMKGKHPEAHLACEKAIAAFPFSPEILTDFALVLIQEEQFEEALETIEKAEILSPNDEDLLLYKSMALDGLGETKAAMELIQKRLPTSANKSPLLNQLGNLAREEGDFVAANNWYQKALNDDPEMADAMWSLLLVHEATETMPNIIPFLEELAFANPLSKNTWLGLGKGFQRLALFEKALDAFEYYLALDPKAGEGWLQKGHSLMNLQRFPDAYNAYLEAFNISGPDPDIYVFLGASQEHQKEYVKAIEYYKKALKIDQEWDDAWYGIGMCFLSQERYIESMHYLRKAIALNPEHELFWLGLAQAEWKTGNVISALEAFEASCNIDPENADVWLDWSFIYYDQGDYDRAIQLILEGIDELPVEAELWYRAVIYALGCGRYKDAINYLENALLLDFDKHIVLFDFFTEIEMQKTIYKLIDKFRTRNNTK